MACVLYHTNTLKREWPGDECGQMCPSTVWESRFTLSYVFLSKISFISTFLGVMLLPSLIYLFCCNVLFSKYRAIRWLLGHLKSLVGENSTIGWNANGMYGREALKWWLDEHPHMTLGPEKEVGVGTCPSNKGFSPLDCQGSQCNRFCFGGSYLGKWNWSPFSHDRHLRYFPIRNFRAT